MKVLSWEEEIRIVESVAQLESLLKSIELQASDTGVPIAVGLEYDANTALLMVVGHDRSHLEYYSNKSRPPLVASCGYLDNDELISFLYYGQPSEVPGQSWVPYADALNAIKQFFLTGERPSNIRWGDDCAEV